MLKKAPPLSSERCFHEGQSFKTANSEILVIFQQYKKQGWFHQEKNKTKTVPALQSRVFRTRPEEVVWAFFFITPPWPEPSSIFCARMSVRILLKFRNQFCPYYCQTLVQCGEGLIKKSLFQNKNGDNRVTNLLWPRCCHYF